MYHEDDPFLGELRRVCLAFPETAEVEAWGRPTFRAGKKIFAVFTGSEEERFAVIFKPEPDERPALVSEGRAGGWLALDFTTAPVDWTEVAELMEGSYRQVALKRMLNALPARD
jgi:hypothetical protein